jgi:hypothetical protein
LSKEALTEPVQKQADSSKSRERLEESSDSRQTADGRILQLQRAIGNRRVAELIRSGQITRDGRLLPADAIVVGAPLAIRNARAPASNLRSVHDASRTIHRQTPDYPMANAPTPGSASYNQQQLPQSSATAGSASGLQNVPSTPGAPLDDKYSSKVKEEAGFSWGKLLSGAKNIKKAGEAYYKIGSLLADKGAPGFFGGGDKQLLVASQNILTVAGALTNTAMALDHATNDSALKEQIEKGEGALKYLEAIHGCADALIAFSENEDALKELEAHPKDAKAAEKWGLAVGESFTALGKALGPVLGLLPAPWGDYVKGLLGAPSAYISAFITIMHNRYDTIDKEAGLKGDMRWGNFSGPMVPIVSPAWFVQPMQPTTLSNYIIGHKDDLGVDMEKAAQSVSLALIISKLQTELTVKGPDGKDIDRTPWLKWLQSQQK